MSAHTVNGEPDLYATDGVTWQIHSHTDQGHRLWWAVQDEPGADRRESSNSHATRLQLLAAINRGEHRSILDHRR